MVELPGNDRITHLLVFFLDAQSRRAQVVSSNVANVDTPAYAAKELDFAESLRQAAYDQVNPGGSGMPAMPRMPLSLGTPMATLASNMTTSPMQLRLPGQHDVSSSFDVDRLGIVDQFGRPVGTDGNSVDMEHEMATLADAGMQYQAGVQLLQSRLRTLRMAIKEGR